MYREIEYIFKLVEDILIVPAEYLKKLSGQIYEIRVQTGNDAYRFLCFFHKGDLIVVTHGFQKKSQKTPSKEIVRAEKLREKYLTKNGG